MYVMCSHVYVMKYVIKIKDQIYMFYIFTECMQSYESLRNVDNLMYTKYGCEYVYEICFSYFRYFITQHFLKVLRSLAHNK